MGARFVSRHPDLIRALVIWDSYPSEQETLKDYRRPVWLIHRADHNGAPPASYQPRLSRFPRHTRFVPIPGGNHMNFGDFVVGRGRQVMDPAITAPAQQHQVVVATLEALASLETIGD